MNRKPLPIGVDIFEKLITRGYYYVDKTLMIKEIIDKKADVNLFIRPRRFGKTLNMTMLKYFFEDARKEDGTKIDYSHIFEGLKIMKEDQKYLSYMGQYPVINLSLKSAKQPDFKMAYAALREEIAYAYRDYSFLCKSDCLDETEKEKYKNIMWEKAEREDYNTSLKFLSQCMYKYFGKKAIILIDEYDVPLENAFVEKFYKEMLDFIRTLFESALKTNPYLEFSVITGCLRISKESIFTGMNNLKIVSILTDDYDEYFGFKEEELADMLMETISFNDAYESFYHGFILGILTGMNGYLIKSNREGGKGRSDIIVKPITRRKPAYVIEFKIADKFNQLEKRAEDALLQIEEKGYARELQDDGYATVIKYGIAFMGKDCLVKMQE